MCAKVVDEQVMVSRGFDGIKFAVVKNGDVARAVVLLRAISSIIFEFNFFQFCSGQHSFIIIL